MSPLEGSKNRDTLLNKLVCVCGGGTRCGWMCIHVCVCVCVGGCAQSPEETGVCVCGGGGGGGCACIWVCVRVCMMDKCRG